MKIIIVCTIFALIYITVVSSDTNSGPLSQECLGCLCHACTGCNLTSGCDGEVCGPFQITKVFWADTNQPTVNNQNKKESSAFANCANDLNCATETVQNYMQKYQLDCNLDGRISCDDFVAIHYLGGGNGCRAELPDDYLQPYLQCKQYAGGEFSN